MSTLDERLVALTLAVKAKFAALQLAATTLTVKGQGSALGSAFSTLNFVGPAVTATDAGGGQANITVTASSNETIYLKDHGILADNATINSAAAVEALIAANFVLAGRGCRIVFPYGATLLDREINVDYPVWIDGYGMGPSKATSATAVVAAAGWNCFNFRSNVEAPSGVGSYGSTLSNMWIDQAGAVSTTGVGNFNGTTGVTLTSGSANFANRQMVLIEGANGSYALPDRVYASTIGSPVLNATIWDTYITSAARKDFQGNAPYFGNYVGYPGQPVTVSGGSFPAGQTISSLGLSSQITLSGNAGATASTLAVTLYAPAIVQVLSGGGTSSLVTDNPSWGTSVTGAVVRHCPVGVYVETGQITVRNVYINFAAQGGACLVRGNTADGVADNCNFENVYFNALDFGVVLEGADSQVNSFFGCNFAGPKIGVLDNSFLGNTFVGCHWAFNNGITVVRSGAQTKIIGGYFESGTSWIGNGQCAAYYVNSIVTGSGFVARSSTNMVDLLGDVSCHIMDCYGGATFRAGANGTDGNSFNIQTNINTPPATLGSLFPANVPLLSMGQSGVGGDNFILSCANNGRSTYAKLHLEASSIVGGTSFGGTQLFQLDATGLAVGGAVTGSNLSGTNTGDQTITLTGNVTGSGTGSFATTIAPGVVTLAMQANMATSSLVYRKTAGAGAPEVNTLATLKTDLGLTGTNSGDQTITLTSDVTGSGTGSFATTIAAGAVTLAKMANLAANSILGNNTGSPATPLALTAAQVKTLLAIGESDVTNLTTDLAAKASLASPVFTGNVFLPQPSPSAVNATATLTIAQLLTLIVTCTSTVAVTMTLPTGTLTDAGILSGALATNEGFEWSIINTGSSSGAITVSAGTAHTIVGGATVAIGVSSRWFTRKTATNTFVTYRLA